LRTLQRLAGKSPGGLLEIPGRPSLAGANGDASCAASLALHKGGKIVLELHKHRFRLP
jgi:hypothetical protein